MRRPRRSSTTPPSPAGPARRRALSVLSFAGVVAGVAAAAAAVTPGALLGVSLPGASLLGVSLPSTSLAGVSLPALLAALPAALVAVATAATWRRRAQLLSGWGAAGLAGLAAAGGLLAVDVAWVLTAAPASGDAVLAALAGLPARAGVALVVVAAAARAGWNGGPRQASVDALGASPAPRARSRAGACPPPSPPPSSARWSSCRGGRRRRGRQPSTVAPCTAGQEQRSYAVSAATVDVPFNRWGATLKSAPHLRPGPGPAGDPELVPPAGRRPGLDPAKNRRLRPRPLVLRANEGECVKVTLTNRLAAPAAHGLPASPRVGIQASGMVVDARTTGGAPGRLRRRPDRGHRRVHHLLLAGPGAGGPLPVPGHGDPRRRRARRRLPRRRPLRRDGRRARRLHLDRPAQRRSRCPARRASRPRSTQAVSTQSGELYVEADIHPPDGAVVPRERPAGAGRDPRASAWASTTAPSRWSDREARGLPGLPRGGDLAVVVAVRRPGAGQARQRPRSLAARARAGDRRRRRTAACRSPATSPTSSTPTPATPTKIRFGLSGREGDARLPPARPPVARRPARRRR